MLCYMDVPNVINFVIIPQILCSSRRDVQAILSGPQGPAGRAVKQLKTINTEGVKPSDFGNEARCELDTRADTCCAGQNCRPIFYTGQQSEVQGFHDTFAPVPDVPITTVATAWSNPLTGVGYILIFHEALYFGSNMDHSLITLTNCDITGLRLMTTHMIVPQNGLWE